MSKVFDTSIMQWRERTANDDIYAKELIQAVEAMEGKS